GMSIAGRDAAAGQGVVEDLLDGSSGRFEIHSPLTLPYPVLRMTRDLEELRVLVVSDDPLARRGLALLLAGQEGITVAGQIGVDEDWPDAREPGAAGWGLGLGGRFGLERLRGSGPAAPPGLAVVGGEVAAPGGLAAGARA